MNPEIVLDEDEQEFLPYCIGNIRQNGMVSTSNRLIRPIELSANEYKAVLYAMAVANYGEKNAGANAVITEKTYIYLYKDDLANLLGLNKRNSINVAVDRIYRELTSRVAHFVIEEPVGSGKKKTKTVHSVVPIIREMRWEDDSKNAIQIRFTSEVLPYFTQLAGGNFTTNHLKYLFALDSIQSISLYRYISKDEYKYAHEPSYEIDLSIDNLKQLIDISESKYDRWVDFRRYVLDRIISDINNHTNLTLSYTTIKKSRSVVGVRLLVEHDVTPKKNAIEHRDGLIYLDVPFEDNAEVKGLGAKFDKTTRSWCFMADDPNFDKFKRWFKPQGCLTDSQASVLINDSMFQMEFAETGQSLIDFKRLMRGKLKTDPEFVSKNKDRINEVFGKEII